MKKILKSYKFYFIYAALLLAAVFVSFVLGMASERIIIFSDKIAEDVVVVSEHIVPEAEQSERTSLGEFELTAYCTCSSCCENYSDGYTATMTVATPGRTIAVDPDVIPYGTVVEIDGNRYIAEDCGEAIKGNHIDVLCASHELAENFGVQYAQVYEISE